MLGKNKKIKKLEAVIDRKKDELKDIKCNLKDEKFKNSTSTLAKLRQAGDVVIETRKLLNKTNKTTTAIAVIGFTVLGLGIAANVATMYTCAKLNGKDIKIIFKKSK